jgi:hypothetical protein
LPDPRHAKEGWKNRARPRLVNDRFANPLEFHGVAKVLVAFSFFDRIT